MKTKKDNSQLTHDWSTVVAGILFILLAIWWGVLQFMNDTGVAGPRELLWGATYQTVALWGGVWGLIIARQWGGMKSVMGRAILALSIGLLFQNLGQTIFSFYNIVLKVDIPYPSLADIGFFGSIPLYIYGTVLLAKASGVSISIKSIKNKIQAVLVPLIALIGSYILFLQGYEFDWSAPLQVFLDFGYPLGQAFYVSLALLTYLLSKKTLGGVMKNRVLLILLALITTYIADFNFLTQAYEGTWMNGGYGDTIYMTAYFFMTLGIIEMKEKFIHTPGVSRKRKK